MLGQSRVEDLNAEAAKVFRGGAKENFFFIPGSMNEAS
jgi:hypothetical protein